MGMIYKRKYKRPDGTIAESPFWRLKYYRDGQPIFENAKTTKETEALKLLKLREGDITRGVPVTPKANRCTFDRAFSLAMKDTPPKVTFRPHVPMLAEDNTRTGFFELHQFEAVRARLAPALQPLVTFMFLTGWRIREVLTLEWRQVDFAAGRVRLEPGTTKNKKGRTFPFTPELRALLDAQREHTRHVERERGAIIAHVFHRQGKPIKDFYTTWRTACRAAGCPGMVPHDFRRTAVRNAVRAGISERVCMQMSGHKTRSVFDRYDIVSEGDLDDAAEKLARAAVPVAVPVGTFAGHPPKNHHAK